jgi:hypothetical protein
LTAKHAEITLHVKYNGLEETFTGSAEDVWLMLNKFLDKLVPTFELANKLLLNVELQKLVDDCAGLIAFSKEGPNILAPRNRITDNETLLLWLLAAYVAHELGMTETDGLSKEELQAKLGKSGKITSTRLSELIKAGTVRRTTNEKFAITTLGIIQMQKEALERIRSKIAAQTSTP